ncbi:MAG TPA: cyclic nucleotide-binding domain-containing protein [Burkholderiales bacterium]|nr:cyclic nucleotide-binding domain-containing protein [Burkholderiales bacterium]
MSIEALQQVSLCRGLDRVAAERLSSVAREVSFLKGAQLVRQNGPARGAFLIRSGTVEARVALPGGGSLAVAELRDGDVFGEMALIERGVCTASVLASSNVEGWFIGGDDFRAMVASREPVALEIQRAITHNLAAKLRVLNAKVREHAAQEDRPVREAAPRDDPLAGVPRTRRASFDWRRFLPLLSFLDGFDEDEADEFVAEAQVLELGPGAWIFAQGQPAQFCYLVVRGAAEVLAQKDARERRIGVAGPGELLGYLAALEGAAHAASARVRERATLLEFPRAVFLALFNGGSGASVSLQHAIHRSLLRSLARTNTQLTRLISDARLSEAAQKTAELETTLHGQLWTVVPPNPAAAR